MEKNKLVIALLMVCSSLAVYAAEPNVVDAAKAESVVVTTNPSTATPPVSSLNVNSKALSDADADWNTLNSLNRKNMIKKEEASLSTPPITAPGSTAVSVSGQTTATNIIVNSAGYKSALLQFNDGSSLQVELGSRVGRYVVKDIDMAGVSLAIQKCSKNGCRFVQNHLVKRSYPKPTVLNGQAPVNQYQQPTQVINNTSSNDVVPPIVSR